MASEQDVIMWLPLREGNRGSEGKEKYEIQAHEKFQPTYFLSLEGTGAVS